MRERLQMVALRQIVPYTVMQMKLMEVVVAKKEWRKPEVKEIKAGAAENAGANHHDGIPSMHS